MRYYKIGYESKSWCEYRCPWRETFIKVESQEDFKQQTGKILKSCEDYEINEVSKERYDAYVRSTPEYKNHILEQIKKMYSGSLKNIDLEAILN